MSTLNQDQQRIPICGIFGHVDSGKTSFLSKLKSYETVEAGGITQGISSIFISIDKMKSLCDKVIDLKQVFAKEKTDSEQPKDFEIKVPGVLFIDTPGHEAFHNFRDKASDICDLGIVIVDIEKGVENQTVDSLKLLKTKKIPFIIVLTKLDKILNWIPSQTSNLKKSIRDQTSETVNMLNIHIEDVKYELSKHEINAEFYFKNKTPAKTYSIIPLSNSTGEGFNDLVNFVIYIVQNFMGKKLILEPKPKIFVMEKSFDKQLGWTLNVILSNGTIKVGDDFLVQTTNGPVKSVIRSIIGLKFYETKRKYIREYQPKVSASDSVIIFGPELENALTGEFAYIYNNHQEFDILMSQLGKQEIKKSFIDEIKTDKLGFYMYTSTEDEFEAGYHVFKSSEILISNGSFGLLNEKSIDMFEILLNKQPANLDEYRILIYYANEGRKSSKLAELEEYAKGKNIWIIYNEVIYKLVEQFKTLRDQIMEKRKEQLKKEGQVFMPVELKLLKQHVYMKGGSSNILCGFKILGGKVNIGTEIISVNPKNVSEICKLGKILKMEKNHKEINEAAKNDEVCIKFENPEHLSYSKHFDESNIFYCDIDRPKLELLKRDFKSDLTKDDWLLTAKIVKMLNI
jgi:translation initiation factor 5B